MHICVPTYTEVVPYSWSKNPLISVKLIMIKCNMKKRQCLCLILYAVQEEIKVTTLM